MLSFAETRREDKPLGDLGVCPFLAAPRHGSPYAAAITYFSVLALVSLLMIAASDDPISDPPAVVDGGCAVDHGRRALRRQIRQRQR